MSNVKFAVIILLMICSCMQVNGLPAIGVSSKISNNVRVRVVPEEAELPTASPEVIRLPFQSGMEIGVGAEASTTSTPTESNDKVKTGGRHKIRGIWIIDYLLPGYIAFGFLLVGLVALYRLLQGLFGVQWI